MLLKLDQALTAYNNGVLDTHAIIKVRIDGEMVETTPGRIMLMKCFLMWINNIM